jgi:hypothetical protein
MSFEIIDGGQSKDKKTVINKVEQLKLFVSHMRALEGTIASIKTMAVKMEWLDLDKRLTSCHDQILDTLSYVKKSTKEQKIKNEINSNKNHLKIVSLKDKE